MRRQGMDAGEASIIVDRCRPPEGIGCAPYTLKAVLWCLRGLGAPGTDLHVYAQVIESRTCLSERAVRKAISTLKDQGVLEQVQAQAPGRPAGYRMHYQAIARWLDPEDRARVRLADPDDDQPTVNTGTRCRRTPASDAGEHRHLVPESDQHRHLVPPTPAPSAATPASGAGVPIRTAGASCISSRRPAAAAAKEATDAAAAAAISIHEWAELAKGAKLETGLAGQCAESLVTAGWTDRKAATVALERLSERLSGSDVRNPVGLFLTILKRPGGPEASKAEVRRQNNAETVADARRCSYLAQLTRPQQAELAHRVEALVPGGRAWASDGRWIVPIGSPAQRAARSVIWAHWQEITESEVTHA